MMQTPSALSSVPHNIAKDTTFQELNEKLQSSPQWLRKRPIVGLKSRLGRPMAANHLTFYYLLYACVLSLCKVH